jgi:hypothetical protein
LIRVVGYGGKQGFIGHPPLHPLHNRWRRIALSLPPVPRTHGGITLPFPPSSRRP